MDKAKVLAFLYNLRSAVDDHEAHLSDQVYAEMEDVIKEVEA